MDKDIEKIIKESRDILSSEKDGAVWLAIVDCADFINLSQMARHYFGRSANWLLQRLHGYKVNGKPAKFNDQQISVLAEALKDIAEKLNEASRRISSVDARN